MKIQKNKPLTTTTTTTKKHKQTIKNENNANKTAEIDLFLYI